MTALTNLLRQISYDSERGATDGDLLHRYTDTRDEAAFAEIVRRNGPLVLRACRSVLGEAAAEDAFQATFLVLARKAGQLTRPGSLAGWLHATAVRIAQNARRADARSRRRETARPAPLVAADEPTWREVREVLDAELAALPEKYRIPLVLCYLQELSYEEAARRAGCEVGALRGRLERGKEQLRKRLAKHGLPLAAPALILGAPNPISAALADATLTTVHTVAAGGVVPPAIAGLIQTTSGLRVALLLSPVAAALMAVGVVLAVGGTPTADAPKVDPPTAKVPKPTTEQPEVAATKPPTDRLGDPLPAGAVARLGTRRLFGADQPTWAAFSPDGTKFASRGLYTIEIFDVTTGKRILQRSGTGYGSDERSFGWRPDGIGIAIIRLHDLSYFVSAFSNPDEKVTQPPVPNPPAARPGPDGLDFVSLTPDATHFASVGKSNAEQFTIDIRPATVGKLVREIKPTKTLGPFAGPCHHLCFTERGIMFWSGSWKEPGDWTISIVDPDKNAIAKTITTPPPAYSVRGLMLNLSLDGRLAAIPTRPRVVKKGQNVMYSRDGTIRVWDLEAGKELLSLPSDDRGYGTGHAFTPDRKQLITTGESSLFRIWDVASGKEVIRSPHHGSAVSIAVSADGKRFATVRWDGRTDIWDTATGKPVVPLETHRSGLRALALSRDNRVTATLAEDDTIRVWETETGKPVQTITLPRTDLNRRERYFSQLAFTPDARGLLFDSEKKLLTLVDRITGKPLDLPDSLRNLSAKVGSCSDDGKTLVTFGGDTAILWNWPAATKRLTITVPHVPQKDRKNTKGAVRIDYAALSRDDRFLFTNSIFLTEDRSAIHNANDVWDARTGKHLHRLDQPEVWYAPGCFSPDNRLLYLGGQTNDMITTWDRATGKLLRRFVEPERGKRFEHFGPPKVKTLAISPDGRILAVAEERFGFDGIWLFETVSGRRLKHLSGHHHDVSALAFTSDGRRLVSVSDDQTGLVWDVTLPALVSGPRVKPTEKELADASERLAGLDPAPAYLGIATLVADPKNAMSLLKEKLRPLPVPTDADLDRITAQLGAEAFADREKASAELEGFGTNAVAGAKTRLATTESPEVRARLTQFLARYNGPNPSPYELRCVRGVVTLEAIGTPEAKEILTKLAQGKPDDVLSRDAAAALARLRERK